MVPALISATALSYWTYEVYATELAAMRLVRERTALESLAGCSARAPAAIGQTLRVIGDVSQQATSIGAGFGYVTQVFSMIPGVGILTRPFQTGRSVTTVTTVANGWLRTVSVGLRAGGAMACNEPVLDGDASAIKKTAMKVINPVSP